ncbi:alpha/beta hydrolase [Mesorhizobium sp. LNHC221B00]|uniref:alpha/beta fold hydrolase n=1 Tax=Mesorhizobium sp. LNHC221B00 TaxID=1287233 RepID=UPI0003CE7DEA|nr:alpha/beta hydrolase [Mesorhizobium sp. LNHC221B00]ESY80863.1 alpha/beta hydrolase [Mesorhizobium sp. LNHC221B00]
MCSFVNIGAIVGAFSLAGATAALAGEPKPTIVLVHGAFAESASWNGVIADLTQDGFTVIAAANPLRSVSGDAAHVASVVGSVKGPVILVGHSYAGTVISDMAGQLPNVKALVYVAAFEPDVGESSLELTDKFPGSTLGPTLAPPVNLANGEQDLYIQQDKFHAQFAADLPEVDARLMAAAQRPVNQAALADRAVRAAWKTLPSWSIYGAADRNIPPVAMAFMAGRAHARKTVVVPGASHLVMVSHAREVAALIEDAANAK